MKAVVYPFTKGTHGLIRFRDLLDFEISAVIDFVFANGCDAGEYIEHVPAGIPVTSDAETALRDVDMLLLTEPGTYLPHTEEFFRLNNIREKFMSMIKVASERKMKILSVYPIMNVPLYRDWLNENNIEIEEVKYIKTSEEIHQFVQKYENISVDEKMIKIGVIGIKSCIGKMTAQLELYKAFKEDRRVYPLITEETGELFKRPGVSYFQLDRMELRDIESYTGALLKSVEQEKYQYFIMADQGGIGTIHNEAVLPLLLKRLFFLRKLKLHEVLLVVDYENDRLIDDCLAVLRIFTGIEKPIGFLLPDKVEVEYGRYAEKSEEDLKKRIDELTLKYDVPVVDSIRNIGRIKEQIMRKYEQEELENAE